MRDAPCANSLFSCCSLTLMQQVSAGLLQPERYLGWYYELPCDTEAQRAKIRRDYMPPDMTEDE